MRFWGLAAAALLAGCSGQSCDPSQVGFLSGIGCEVGGSYAARNQAQQRQLSYENSNASAAQSAQQQEQSRESNALLTRDQARRRLNAVDRQNGQLRARIAALRRSGNADRAQLNEAERELNAVQRDRAVGPSSDADIRALEARQRRAAELLGGA